MRDSEIEWPSLQGEPLKSEQPKTADLPETVVSEPVKAKRKRSFKLDLKRRWKSWIPKTQLGSHQVSAGAGIVGLVGFFALFLVASLFFITENYFIAMFIMSLALLVYVTGIEVGRIFVSCFTVFFSSRHLVGKATELQEVLPSLKTALGLRKSPKGQMQAGPLENGALIKLPENGFSQELKKIIDEEKEISYADYSAHSHYVECHELYSYTHANLDFIANAMPLFGLIGTILGLIAMFDSLGANVTVESLAPQLALALKTTLYGAIFSSLYKIISSRFEQRQSSLEYDYETLSFGLEVMFKNKIKIEVENS